MSLKSLKNQTLRNKSTVNSVNLTGGASTGPVITSIVVTDASYNNLDDTAIVPAGGYAKLIGSGFASGCSAYFNGSSVTTTFVSATEVRVVIPAIAAGTYNIMLFNASTAGAIYLNLGISSAPTFTTTAGSLGTSYETTAVSTSIAATGDAPITYALYSGSLPSGVTLASNGTLSGTSPVEASSTTYSFVVQATDAQLQDTTRSFSLTISSDIVTWSTPAADYAHALTGNSVMANVSLSAASAAGYGITYAANTLPTGVALSGATIYGTPTTEQTVYTALTATAATTGRTATRYVSWSVSLGDTYWKYLSLLLNGALPASTFIADSSNNNLSLTLNGDTRPSNFNPYTPGYYSNYFDGTGDYLTFPSNAAFVFGTGDFTIELWVNQQNWNPSGGAYYSHWISINSYLSGIMVRPNTTGTGIQVYVGGTDYLFSTTLSLNTWFHVAVSRSSSSMRVFVNGTQIGATQTVSYNISTNTSNAIGTAVHDTSEEMRGYLSNVRVLKGTGLYAANFTPSTAPLTAIAGTSLLTCQSNRLIDNSLNNFAITKNGDTTVSGFAPFTPPTSVTVNNLYSTFFDGTGDWLTVPSNAALNFGTGDFTIEAWVYPNSLAADWFITSGTGTGGLFFGYRQPTGGYGWGRTGVAWDYSVASGTSSVWQHVALTRSGTSMRLFVNGTQVGTTQTLATSYDLSLTSTTIGSQANSYYLNGNISNLRVLKGTALYTANFTPATTNLTAIANTSLLTCQNSTIIDNSNNVFTITSTGDARPLAVSPFTQTTTAVTTTYLGSGYFDGTGDSLTIPAGTAFAPGTGNFTIEGWYYSTAASGNQQIWAQTVSGLDYFSVWFIPGTYQFRFIGNSVELLSPALATPNSWNHFAIVRVGTALSVYCNGIGNTPTTMSTNFSNTTYIPTISGYTHSAVYMMTGYLSNLRYVKGTALYTANFAPPVQPLTAVANTSLLTLQTNQPAANKQFVDNSGNNFLVTQVGNTTQGSFSPYGGNWSNYFNGSGDNFLVASGPQNFYDGNPLTVEGWFFASASSDNQITTNYATSSTGWGVSLSAGKLSANLSGDVGDIIGTTTVVLNTWNHFALSGTAGSWKLFLNGVQEGSTYTGSVTLNSTQGLTIGALRWSGATYSRFSGYISNFLITQSLRYTTTFTPPSQPLTPVTSTYLLTCNSNSISDSGPNNIQSIASYTAGGVSVQRFSPFSPVTQTPQTYSGYFDGVWANVNSGDYLTLNGQSNFAFGSNNFTVEMWVYATSFSANVVLYDGRPGSTSGVYGILYYDTAGIVTWNVNALSITGTAITLNTWNHLAASRSGTTTKLFINGTEVGTATDTNSYLNGALAPTIGTSGYSRGSNSMQGYISNVRVVNGTAVYTANFTPSTTPLTAIANTSLLTCQSPTFIDNSTNAFAITVVGDAKPRAYNPFGFTNNSGQDYTPALYGGSFFTSSGQTNYLTVPATGSALPFAGDFTLELWVYSTSRPNNATLWSTNTSSIELWINTSGTISYYTTAAVRFNTTLTVPLNAWCHVALVRFGGVAKVYINGVADAGSYTSSTSIGASTDLWYVGRDPGASGGFNGYYSDIRSVNGTALYKSNFVPPLAPLTAISGTTLLLNMDKAGISDKSRSVDLETVGDAKIVYENPYNGSYYSNYFDGTGDYLTVPDHAAWDLGSNNFTIESWVYPTASPSQPIIIGQWTSVYSWAMMLSNDGNRYLRALINYAGYNDYVSSTSLQLNAWNHCAFVRESNTVSLYLNGARVYTTSFSGIPSPGSSAVSIGADASGSQPFQGYLSNARVVVGTALYSGTTYTVPTAPLTAIANTKLLTCQSKSFVDNSSNPFAITRNGDVAVRSINPLQRNTYSSMYFDGTGDWLTAPYSTGFTLGTGNFTIESWVNPNSGASNGILQISDVVGGFKSAAYTNSVALAIAASNAVIIWANGTSYTTSTNKLPFGVWTHLAMVRSSGVTKLYINGVLETSIGTAGSITDTTNYAGTYAVIGAYYNTTLAWNGYIADLRITKAARYTTTFTPPTSQFLTI